jgi:hypothetical protein
MEAHPRVTETLRMLRFDTLMTVKAQAHPAVGNMRSPTDYNNLGRE